ncbi:MAG: bacteriohopanetetrol glucosamine biosynthesis glycosyltransferase HpnI [Nitrospirota bacterium]
MHVILAILLLLWLSAASYYIISAYCLASFYKNKSPENAAPPDKNNSPSISVLKPLKGADPNLYENLKSFLEQDYPCFQVIFGVSDRSDPAYSVARRLVSEYPEKEMLLVETGPARSPNRKVSNLSSMYPFAKYDIILVADADMLVGRQYLSQVSEGFDDPAVGLVTCPYRGCNPKSVGAAFEALTINADFFPSVTVAEKLEGVSFALGATMAARREALEEIGGFEALKDFLADDYQFGNKIYKSGYKLKLSRFVVDSIQDRESLREYFTHQLRWGRTYRACRPVSYFFAGLTKGTAIAAIFLMASGFSPAGWALFSVDLALRNSLAVWLERNYIKAPGTLKYYWLLPARDLTSALIWFLSFTGSTISWKGESFKIDREGRMVKRS